MTTIIISYAERKVYSDSRATETITHKEVSLNPFKKIKVTEEKKFYDATQKIFEVDGHIVAGSGSLEVLKDIVKTFEITKSLPNKLTRSYKYTPSDTEVALCKVGGDGKMHSVVYKLTPTNFRDISNIFTGVVKCDMLVTKKIPSSDYYVLGSGMDLARGNLVATLDCNEAIEVAKRFDEYSGGATVCMDCVTLETNIDF